MAVFKRGDVEKALKGKGFKESQTHHTFYHLYVDGKRTHIYTYVSHGRAGTDIGVGLIKMMADQVKLSKRQFEEFIRCSFSGKDLINELRRKGEIKS